MLAPLSASPDRPRTSGSVPALAGSPVSAGALRPVSAALRLALRPVSVTLRLMLRVLAHDPAMHDTKTTTSNRCRRHVPTTPLRVVVPLERPQLTTGAAGVLLEMLREARPASQDQEEPLDAA
jgi:hypothetical protein